MDEDEGDGAGVGRRDEGGEDDEAGGQDRDHVGEKRVSLTNVLGAETEEGAHSLQAHLGCIS